MTKRHLLFALAAILIAHAAEAGTCAFRVAPQPVSLGFYSTTGGGLLTVVSNYEVRCTPNTSGSVTFTSGANTSTYFPRYLASGGNLIGYNIHDIGPTGPVLGDGTGGTTVQPVVNATPQNKDFPLSFHVTAPEGTDVPTGTYVDTVNVILTWDGTKTTSVSFTVTTIVQAECSVTTMPVNFGNYDPVAANAASPLDTTGSVNVLCTAGTVATVSLGTGQNFAGGTRRMAGPLGSFLTYQLFRDPGRSSIWSTAPNTVSGTSTSNSVPINGGMTVYGRVPAAQDPRVGVHTDTVLATVNY
jgi:spore coat protein U-like protein